MHTKNIEYLERRDAQKLDQIIRKKKLRRAFIFYQGDKPYVKPKTSSKESFTQKLRNDRGYQDYLNKKYNLAN